MTQTASWRRLDVAGRDTARLIETGDGWRLEGRAIFDHQGDEAHFDYALSLDANWRTRKGIVTGWIGERSIERIILHDQGGWILDGRLQNGLGHCLDLDYGFTPATNLPQIRRLNLEIGQSADFTVAWLDDEAASLTELPQFYERISEHAYRYASPTGDYRAVLEMAPNGFVRVYPGLWEMAK